MVDDEADLDMMIKQRFRHDIKSQKYAFMFARNGREALDIMADHPDIEIVLSDLNMPEMSGLELLQELKKHYAHVKVLILSAYADQDNKTMAFERGAHDFITKPVSLSALDTKLKELTDSPTA